MRSVNPVGRLLAAVVAAIFLLVLTNTAVGQQPKPADKLAVDMAIDKGVKYLRDSQDNKTGGWGKGTGAGQSKGWGVGHTALAAIALLECGTPNTDPSIKKAADAVRYYVNRNEVDYTYEISLAILLLDRMGGGRDDKIRIQFLASRLMAGQTLNGGWYYTVPKVNNAESTLMLSALRSMSPPQPTPIPSVRERPFTLGLCIKTSDEVIPQAPPKQFDPEKARTDAVKRLTPTMQKWPVFMSANQLAMRPSKDIHDCNSNTHFAALAVWAARKHDVPVEHSLALLARRFRTSQAADGSWGYNYGNGGSSSMTCVALLGLAIGHVVEPEVGVPPEKDPKVVNGFAWLSKRIQAPKGFIDNQPQMKAIGGLYYMWAMERIAVIYDVTKLDKKDWYQWGAEILLCHQKPDGSWEDGGYHGENQVLNTSFALLFLRRANLTPDLSRRFTIDTAALTAKVADTVEPPKVPLDPPRMPDPEPEPIAIAPYPHDAKVTTPITTTPTPQPQAAAEQPSTPPAKEGSGMLWIIIGIVTVLVLGLLLFFLLRKKKDDDEDDKPKKKKKKKKSQSQQMKVSSKSEMKVKSKPKVEEEDDDD